MYHNNTSFGQNTNYENRLTCLCSTRLPWTCEEGKPPPRRPGYSARQIVFLRLAVFLSVCLFVSLCYFMFNVWSSSRPKARVHLRGENKTETVLNYFFGNRTLQHKQARWRRHVHTAVKILHSTPVRSGWRNPWIVCRVWKITAELSRSIEGKALAQFMD